MPCYDPLHGFRSRSVNPTGKRSIVFSPSEGYRDMPVTLPCGQCIGCRLERSRQWAIRCVHETQMHENNIFITLTYAPEHLPKDSSLQHEDFQKFMKRLRKKFSHESNNMFGLYQPDIRYYMCGEYGDKNDRPHYHALLFNFNLPDCYPWKIYRGNQYYISPTLSEIWGLGHAAIGEANFETAAYIARYILKKRLGKDAQSYYDKWDSKGEILSERKPEYNNMSRRSGIGKNWFEKYKSDVFPKDEVIIRERQMRPPKYYDRLFEAVAPKTMKRIKKKRTDLAKKLAHDNTYERLRTKELKKRLDTKCLVRSYENET